MTRRGIVILLASVAVVGAVAFFGRDGGGADQPAPAASAAAPAATPKVMELAEIEVTRVERQDLAAEVRVSGSLQPVRRSSLNAKVSGTLAEISADIGDKVRAGDVLARFDPKDLQASLDERAATLDASKAQLTVAEATLNRTRSLSGSGISSRATLDQAQSEVSRLRASIRALEAQVETARTALIDAVVRAPFDGVVSRRPVEPGQTVGVNTELFGLVDLTELEVTAGVPASRIAEIATGQTARLKVEGYGDRAFTAEVTRISPVAEANSRSINVYLRLANPDEALRGGMFASGSITVRAADNVVALPAAALRKDGEGDFVLKVENEKLVRQPVTSGPSWQDGRLVEIASGVTDGDVVVTAPLPDLKPDTAIRIARL